MYEKIKKPRNHRSTVLFTCDCILINGHDATIQRNVTGDSGRGVPSLSPKNGYIIKDTAGVFPDA
jgi:hypothetical protein